MVTNPVNSTILILETQETVSMSVDISASVDSTFCLGEEVVFTTMTEHAGDSPTYIWTVNGGVVGENEATFVTDLLENMDAITCQVTSSAECVEVNPLFSNEIIVSVDSCAVPTKEELDQKATILVYPNPTAGKIFVKISQTSANFTARLLNAQGQLLLTERLENSVAPYTRELNLTHLPKGVYYLQIVTDEYLTVERIVVD